MTAYANIASAVSTMAQQQPTVPAIYFPGPRGADGQRSYSQFTYAELDRESDIIAAGLNAIGIVSGTRAALMVKPSLEFFALTFGIFKAGAVPVMIDPGIGLKNLKTCLAEAAPEAFIGIPTAHAARLLLGWARESVRTVVTVGRRWLWGGYTLDAVRAAASDDWQRPHTTLDDLAAILFTSGSTGVPKGVEYTHRTFLAQVELIRDMYGIVPGEIDLPTFPLFALFDPALGMTTVIPHMDFTKPASVDPTEIFEPIKRFGVTNMFGSPALLRTVGNAASNEHLPTLQRVISAGAPVPATVMESVLRALPETARVHTPYGATECLPVCSISSYEVLGETRAATDAGKGVCVGAPIAAADVRVIRISDDAIAQWDESLLVASGEIGEIVVKGEMVTRAYFRRDEATRLAKIADGPDVWHRMGDLGRFDDAGRIWFCGRKSHRVVLPDRTLFTVPIESRFNTHAAVYRSALVGAIAQGRVVPTICVEREPKSTLSDSELLSALRQQAADDAELAVIEHFFVHPAFPVDIRHNAKINRERLAQWATEKL